MMAESLISPNFVVSMLANIAFILGDVNKWSIYPVIIEKAPVATRKKPNTDSHLFHPQSQRPKRTNADEGTNKKREPTIKVARFSKSI
jgi:hypothetical protein